VDAQTQFWVEEIYKILSVDKHMLKVLDLSDAEVAKKLVDFHAVKEDIDLVLDLMVRELGVKERES
jgi:hypothetical protein